MYRYKKIISILLVSVLFSAFYGLPSVSVSADYQPTVYFKTFVNDVETNYCEIDEDFEVEIHLKDARNIVNITLPIIETPQSLVTFNYGEAGVEFELIDNGIYNGGADRNMMLIAKANGESADGLDLDGQDIMLVKLFYTAAQNGVVDYIFQESTDISPVGVVMYDNSQVAFPGHNEPIFPDVENCKFYIGVIPPSPTPTVPPSPSDEPPGGGGGGNPPVQPEISPPIDPTPDAPLLDTDNHYAYINGYVEDGINLVKPDAEIVREEVAAIFFRLLKAEVREEYRTLQHRFSDVNLDMWARESIATLNNAGVIKGYKDGTFRPEDPITRAEFITIIARFAGISSGTRSKFFDVVGCWAEQYIVAVTQRGWITGYSDGSFRPDQPITRAEAVKVTNKILGRYVDDEGILKDLVSDFEDLSGTHWSYYEIQEAAVSHVYMRRYEYGTLENWLGKGQDLIL
ncbi:MAG: S-layer homology domain-containing protein [Clostridiales bacterium]|jgi:hypothetical protein|nr:S-layer homology domain-containing protein [Clostridiales bacterium]